MIVRLQRALASKERFEGCEALGIWGNSLSVAGNQCTFKQQILSIELSHKHHLRRIVIVQENNDGVQHNKSSQQRVR